MKIHLTKKDFLEAWEAAYSLGDLGDFFKSLSQRNTELRKAKERQKRLAERTRLLWMYPYGSQPGDEVSNPLGEIEAPLLKFVQDCVEVSRLGSTSFVIPKFQPLDSSQYITPPEASFETRRVDLGLVRLEAKLPQLHERSPVSKETLSRIAVELGDQMSQALSEKMLKAMFNQS